MMKKIIYTVLVAFFCVAHLSACAEKEITREKYDNVSTMADTSLEKIQGIKSRHSSLIVEQKPWYGNSAVRFLNGDPLPDSLMKDDALVLTFEKPLPILEVASQIQGAVGLRVTVDHTPQAADNGTGEGEDLFVPADGEEVTGGRILWQGNLKNLLDQVADRFDAEWSYDGRGIKISRHIVRTYLLHALAGDLTLEGSVTAGSEGLPSQSIESEADISIWDEIQEAVENIVSGRGRATFSPATGTITVSGTPSSLQEVERYLRLQNDLRLRRVAVDVKVLSVLFSKSNNFNFDMSVLIKDAIGNQPFIFDSISSGDTSRDITTGLVRSVNETQYELDTDNAVSLVINALDAVADKVSVIHSGTIITMSDQAAPLQVAKKRSYVASISGTATDGATATSIEPGTIDIGMTMNILPRVISSDKVMLRLAVGITDLADLREFTSSGASVQLPEVDTTGFLQNAVLTSGETLVVAGFERETTSDTEVGTGYSWNMLLGGQQGYGHSREVRVLLLKAQILPEEQLDILTDY